MSVHTKEELHQLGREFGEAFNARDLDRFDRLIHPDLRWHIAVTESIVTFMNAASLSRPAGMLVPQMASLRHSRCRMSRPPSRRARI